MQIVLHKQSNDIKLSMYAKNSNKIDLWTTSIESLEMQEIIHHENFLQIRASALHSVEPYWSEYDTLGRFGGGPLILAILSWIALPRWCCWSVVYTYSTLVYMRPLLHIAAWWFFHGLWSLMMLLHSVQSNVHSLGNTLLFVYSSIEDKKLLHIKWMLFCSAISCWSQTRQS